jgi:hypothetical protein
MLGQLAELPAQPSAWMAQQNTGCGCGCGTVLALFALGLLLAYWPLFLAFGLVALAIYGLAVPGQQQKKRQLQALVEIADRRVRNDPCRVRDRFGVIQSISLAGDLFTPRLDIVCRSIANPTSQPDAEEIRISLRPPAEPLVLRSATGVGNWLSGAGITRLDDLSVEAKAIKAALECQRELAWTRDALVKLGGLRTLLLETLAKAKGNELLEPAIPQLEQALLSFEQEKGKLQRAHQSAGEMLRKLHDFLSVPDGIRPILSFDLDQLFDPQRFADLEQSFSDVVLLNDAFRQLSKDKLT